MNASSQPPERTRQSTSKRVRASKRTMVATTVAVLALLIGAGATLAAGFLTHRVQSGDTLSELALDYDTTVEELADMNGIENPDLIVVNDDLLIRALEEGDNPEEGVRTHTIVPGDTLSTIAESLGVTVEELAAANGLANPDLIVTGDLLRVPTFEPVEAANDTTSAQTESDDDSTTESTASDEAAAPVLVTNEIQPPMPANTVQSGSAILHLVLPGETADSIAEVYGVSAAQLLAANGHARNGITTGMILKVPPKDSASVQLVGMPTAIEASAVGSELTAVSVATAYWGSSLSETAIYAALEMSDNPHFGFRGDIDGAYGGTDDYGVYAGPLAEVLSANGFVGETFYAGGDATELTWRIDQGLPVVVWITYETAVATPQRIDDDVRPFTVVPGKQAAVVYGYDDEGVLIADVATGGYSHINWTDFMRSWNYFDGMGLAVSPI